MDVGDVLVLEDIVELWKLRPELEQHFLAVSYAWALGQHLNAGLVLYNLRRMRQGNFTELTLRAAVWEVERGDGICPRDQNILNMLHDEDFLGSLRSLGSLEDGKIMRILPCRWSLFPAVDWHPAWSKPDLWHPELFQRMRYPGLVSSTQVQPKKLIGSTDGGIHAVPRCILQVQLLYIIWQDWRGKSHEVTKSRNIMKKCHWGHTWWNVC